MSKPWLNWPKKLIEADQCEVFRHLSTNWCLGPVLKEVRARFFKLAEGVLKTENSAVMMQGASETPVFDADCDREFVQEPYFKYLFGVDEPDIIGVVDMTNKKAMLFVPTFPEEYQRVMGPPRPFKWYEDRFDVKVYPQSAYKETLAGLGITHLHIMSPTPDSDSKLPYPLIPTAEWTEGFTTDDSALHKLLTESRVLKTPAELQVLKWANEANSRAHAFIQLHCRPGMMERQMEALFRGHLGYAAGNRGYLHYGAIVAGGPRAATLHYGHAAAANDEILEDGDLVLVDMGGLFQGYGADITHTYPVNGKFTEKQKTVYNAVLAAHDAVFAAMKPGMNWLDCHRLAETTILQHLQNAGILKGITDFSEAIEAGLGAVFMPHGLGHFLGMRTHDVGGFTEKFQRGTRVGLTYCRTARDLEAGMYITLEPGCYFVDFLLNKAIADPVLGKWIAKEEVDKYRGMGGVRIESNIAVTPSGADNYSIVPRTVEDIEEFMALGKQL